MKPTIRWCVVVGAAVIACKSRDDSGGAKPTTTKSPTGLTLPIAGEQPKERGIVVAVVFVDAAGGYRVAKIDKGPFDKLPAVPTTPGLTDVEAVRKAAFPEAGNSTSTDHKDESEGSGSATSRGPDDPNEDPNGLSAKVEEMARESAKFRGGDGDGTGYSRLPGGVSEPLDLSERVVIAAAADAPAIAIARILTAMSAALAVSSNETTVLLSPAFSPGKVGETLPFDWSEAHLEADGVHLITMPSLATTTIPWKSGALDRAALASAIAKVEHPGGVDVVVGATGSTAQQLVDTVAALDSTKTVVSVAARSGTSAQRLTDLKSAREKAFPVVSFGASKVSGEFDKRLLRPPFNEALAKLQSCYEAKLATKPTLRGMVITEFQIDPDGAARGVTAAGVDPDVASCVATVVRDLKFPKPKNVPVKVKYRIGFNPVLLTRP